MNTASPRDGLAGSRSDVDAEVRETQRARERMRYVKPRSAGKVIAHHRYWTTQFLRLYLSRCDELAFESPPDAYLFAQQAPELARRIRVGETSSEFATPKAKLDGIVTALAIQVTCFCALGELGEARQAVHRAERGLGGREASAEAMAELRLRQAALELLSGENEASIEAVDACLRICTDHGLLEIEADAISMRGYLWAEKQPRSKLCDLLEAASTAPGDTQRGSRTAHAALNHLIWLAREGQVAVEQQEGVLRLLPRLQQQNIGARPSSRKWKPFWVEGLMLGNLGIGEQAKRRIGKARKGLRRLKSAGEFSLASLDLAKLHVRLSESDLAHTVLVDTYEAIQSFEDGDDLANRLAPFIVVSPTESEMLRAHRVLPPMPTMPGIVPAPANATETRDV